MFVVNDKEHNVLTVASNSENSIKHCITNQYGSAIVEHSAFGEWKSNEYLSVQVHGQTYWENPFQIFILRKFSLVRLD